jgi:RND family efflux transporter MFP subunit
MDKLQVVAEVSERDVGQLKNGLRAEIKLQAFPGEKFDAVVERVAPVVNPDTRTKEIILKFGHSDPRINTGMFARIKLNTHLYEDRLVVPEEAVVLLRGKNYVYIVAGETASLRQVEVGVTVDNLTEITSGLKADEDVVTQGQQLLSDGVKVRVIGGTKA